MRRFVEFVVPIGTLCLGGVAWACLPSMPETLDLEVREVLIDGVVQEDVTPWDVPTRITATVPYYAPDVIITVDGVPFGFTEPNPRNDDYPRYRPL